VEQPAKAIVSDVRITNDVDFIISIALNHTMTKKLRTVTTEVQKTGAQGRFDGAFGRAPSHVSREPGNLTPDTSCQHLPRSPKIPLDN